MSLSQFIQTHSKQMVMALFIVGFAAVGTTLLVMSRAAVAVNSVQSGPWSSPSTWSGGHVPEAGDTITIEPSHTVTYDVASGPVLGAMTINGTLTFDPAKSAKLTTEQNIIVTGNGKLNMKPNSATIEHFIQFVNVDEKKFVGGAIMPMNPSEVPATDVGLWVIQSGQLNFVGTPKTSWTNAADSLSAGATSVTLKDAPTGWRVGDTIIISPTEDPTKGSQSYDGVEERVITAISGNTVSFNQGLNFPHPKVNNKWTAEVGNLTRNVRVEGTSTPLAAGSDWVDRERHNGNSHIFFHAKVPQTITNTQLRYMGTAAADEGVERPQIKLGRYALHFHHMANGSRGTIVDGVVVRDANFRQFVPHASNGITMTNNIAYNNKSSAFWWDPHDIDPNSDSHDTIWDRNLVAKMQAFGRDDSPGFFLLAGHNNRANNNVVVGTRNSTESMGAYLWVNSNEGMWVFDGNTAHNNQSNGIHVWQNAKQSHPITNFSLYYNQFYGIAHGAYVNDYNYINGFVYGNRWGGLKHQANASSPIQQTYQNIVWDGAGITPVLVWGTHSSLNGSLPVLFSNNTFKGYTKHAVLIGAQNIPENGAKEYGGGGLNDDEYKQFDIVNPTFEGSSQIAFGSGTSNSNSRVRVQPKDGGQPYQVTSGNTRTNLSKFAPDNFGSGTGLLAEHFLYENGQPQFNNPIFTRRENTLTDHYAQDTDIPPYWISPWPQNWTVRLTGEFEAQATTNYTFIRDKYMGLRLWINDQQIINAFNESDREVRSTPLSLVKGQRYKIRAELNFFDDSPTADTRFLYYVFMESDAYKRADGSPQRLVPPMAQLYCGTNPACTLNASYTPPSPVPDPTPTPTPTPDTTAPSVSITQPANNATISGTVNVTANASDNVGVTQVDFVVDGLSRSVDNTAPFGYGLNTLLLELENGDHTINAVARDGAGNTATSSTIVIRVNNPEPEPVPEPEPTPEPVIVPEDINRDGVVNMIDVNVLKTKFGQSGNNLGRSDINGDRRVNMIDVGFLKRKFGT